MSSTKEPKEMSKRQARRDQMRRKGQRDRYIGIGLIAVGVIVALAIILFMNYGSSASVGDITAAPEFPRPNPNGNSAGDPNAPIKIDEYSDFQCPYCRLFYENTEAQIMNKYVKPGTVYFTYHSVGLFIGDESVLTAEAAYCAGDQNKFWEMHDIIFTNQPDTERSGYYTNRRLTAFAEKIGLNMGDFNTCLGNGKYSSRVSQDQSDAQTIGIKGTPSLLISYTLNGEKKSKLLENVDLKSIEAEIAAALAALGK